MCKKLILKSMPWDAATRETVRGQCIELRVQEAQSRVEADFPIHTTNMPLKTYDVKGLESPSVH